jgi:hypothetical protein
VGACRECQRRPVSRETGLCPDCEAKAKAAAAVDVVSPPKKSKKDTR